MFTGIVEFQGTVAEIEPHASGLVLTVDAAGWAHRPEPGESIAVNGCCLTATAAPGGRIRFDVIKQTLDCTTLGGLAVGDRVNLEHAATPTTLMGGHVVQGHVDAVAEVERVTGGEEEHRVTVVAPSKLASCLVDKGSVALDGVSLTIATNHGEGRFDVALIPTTLDLTTLGAARPGTRLNIEADYLVKAVVSWLEQTWGRDARPPGT